MYIFRIFFFFSIVSYDIFLWLFLGFVFILQINVYGWKESSCGLLIYLVYFEPTKKKNSFQPNKKKITQRTDFLCLFMLPEIKP